MQSVLESPKDKAEAFLAVETDKSKGLHACRSLISFHNCSFQSLLFPSLCPSLSFSLLSALSTPLLSPSIISYTLHFHLSFSLLSALSTPLLSPSIISYTLHFHNLHHTASAVSPGAGKYMDVYIYIYVYIYSHIILHICI